MFNVEEFYKECRAGKKVDCSEIFKYIASFKYVIMRGAAAQGAALGKKLIEEGIKTTAYWDVRANEIGYVNGIAVEMPFAKDYPRDEAIIIHAIPNNVIMNQLINEMKRHGYNNIIQGDMLYSACICTYHSGDKLSAKRCWQNGGECRPLICEKASGIIKNYSSEKKEGDRIDLTYVTFILNSICNLSCRDCVQFIPNYPVEARKNVPFEIISRDIDLFFDMVDSVGTISAMGGETFIHPDIAKIANKFAEKENLGFVSFPTNGLYPIKPEQLEGIEDPRINITFGYYLHRATEQQKEIYHRNIELVKKYGISYTEARFLPLWNNPGTLKKLDINESDMIKKKQNCKMPIRNFQIKNGKTHVCDRSVALTNMNIVDYKSDYVDLTQKISRGELRQQFRDLMDRSYYNVCAHCKPLGNNVDSAIQGVKEIL